MSNDDIVMANYSMLLEVYFLFMDINLSLSGISLALLCERRDLQEETRCCDGRGKGHFLAEHFLSVREAGRGGVLHFFPPFVLFPSIPNVKIISPARWCCSVYSVHVWTAQ